MTWLNTHRKNHNQQMPKTIKQTNIRADIQGLVIIHISNIKQEKPSKVINNQHNLQTQPSKTIKNSIKRNHKKQSKLNQEQS